MAGSQIQLLTVGDVALLFQFLQCLVYFGFSLVGGVLLKLLIGFISQQVFHLPGVLRSVHDHSCIALINWDNDNLLIPLELPHC